MRKVIGIGETVFDIIFRNRQPEVAIPGGSTFNAMVSLGRCGINTSFISEAGDDIIGEEIISFLRENGVDSSGVNRFPNTKSPVSLAFLNEHNDAEYIFYKDHPHDQLEFQVPEIEADDIVIFGSFYAVNPVIRPQVAALLDNARNKGAIIYYDINFRSSHRNDIMRITPNLLDNLEYSDIVRGSCDDFKVLYNKDNADKIYDSEISFYCKQFVFTNGSEPIEVRAGDVKKAYNIKQTKVVSTIGAGDNFNAGFVYGLIKHGITRDMIVNGLDEEKWDMLIESGMEFSANCCGDILNYISPEFGKSKRLK